MSNNNNVTIERKKFTKTEKQYLRGIIHNLSLQRLTDQEIVDFLQREKKIDISRSTVTKIRNQVVEEAGNWYIELRESATKTIAFFKERLDSLLSYQKKLHDIISVSEKPEVQVRAISELHSIEMSLHSLFKELPQFNIESESSNTHTLERCNCPTSVDRITHSKCRYCHQVWCATTLNQDWCPNPDCSQGIKGCNFQPWDEHNKWIKCPTCEMWFKNTDILAVHNCYIKVNPGIGDEDSLPGPGIGGEGVGPIIEQSPNSNEPEPEPEIITSLSSPIEEHTETETEEEEPEESEADRYWRNHPARVGLNNNNNKVKFVVD